MNGVRATKCPSEIREIVRRLWFEIELAEWSSIIVVQWYMAWSQTLTKFRRTMTLLSLASDRLQTINVN